MHRNVSIALITLRNSLGIIRHIGVHELRSQFVSLSKAIDEASYRVRGLMSSSVWGWVGGVFREHWNLSLTSATRFVVSQHDLLVTLMTSRLKQTKTIQFNIDAVVLDLLNINPTTLFDLNKTAPSVLRYYLYQVWQLIDNVEEPLKRSLVVCLFAFIENAKCNDLFVSDVPVDVLLIALPPNVPHDLIKLILTFDVGRVSAVKERLLSC